MSAPVHGAIKQTDCAMFTAAFCVRLAISQITWQAAVHRPHAQTHTHTPTDWQASAAWKQHRERRRALRCTFALLNTQTTNQNTNSHRYIASARDGNALAFRHSTGTTATASHAPMLMKSRGKLSSCSRVCVTYDFIAVIIANRCVSRECVSAYIVCIFGIRLFTWILCELKAHN